MPEIKVSNYPWDLIQAIIDSICVRSKHTPAVDYASDRLFCTSCQEMIATRIEVMDDQFSTITKRASALCRASFLVHGLWTHAS